MRRARRCAALALAAAGVISMCLYPTRGSWTAPGPPLSIGSEEALRAFAVLRPIDTHAHVFKNDPSLWLSSSGSA